MLPFALSISILSVAQAATVALAAPDPLPWLARLRSRRWALVPAGSVAVVVVAVAVAAQFAQGLSYLALVAVPPLAALALGRAVRHSAPPLAAAVVALFALAWLDRRGLAGEGAALVLCALSCVALGTALTALAPRRALKAGVIAMALVDAGLVIADLLQAPNNVLNAAHPAAGLPQLQRVVFGSAVMGYGDLFIAGVVGAMLAARPRRQREGALLAGALALLFELLFLAVHELPATVPVALALVLVDRRDRAVARSPAPSRTPLAVKS